VINFESARLGLAAEHPDPYRAAAPTTFTGAPIRRCSMATTRADRHLPLILNRRTKSDAERQAAFDALVVHLELTKKLERFRRARKGRGDKHEAAADFFMSLAYGLMQRI
jgi:hypothetical protein